MASQDHGIYSFEECVPEGIDYLQQTLEECTQDEARPIIREEKMGETDDQDLTIQRRSLKWWGIWRTQFLKILLSILSIWIRNDEWRRWWSWMKESTHETNKDKYSIVISWYRFVMHLFIFSWCIMHDITFALMTVYY